MNRAKVSGLMGLVVVGVWASLASAHTDDPKILDHLPPYEGPALRGGGYANNGGFNSLGINLLSWLPLAEFGPTNTSGNTCWGYVSPSGREYALMGLSGGTGFVEVTDPLNPVIVSFQTGPQSLWRDLKKYQNYVYAVSEAGQGIQVFNVNNIDNGVVTFVRNVTTGGTAATHTVFVDETSGFLYRCGGDGNGLRIYSLADPSNPVYVTAWSDRYVHECQVWTYTQGPFAGRQIAYCCSGFNGGFDGTGLDVLDVTNKANIINLARIFYPNPGYSHQAWLSEDLRYLYLDDELDEPSVDSTVHVFDVLDPANPFWVSSFTNGNTAITHNLYVVGDLLIESNYTSGVRIFDISNPTAGQEIAFFDSRPENDAATFNGSWGNYPFFPSGTLILSDLERGMMVLEVNLNTVSIDFPDGVPGTAQPNQPTPVTVAISTHGAPVNPASVTLHARIDGGTETQVGMADIGNGQFQGDLPAAACLATIEFYVSAQNVNGDMFFNPQAAPATQYAVSVYSDLTYHFQDNFQANLGWTVQDQNLSTGSWDRGNPALGGNRGNPTVDFDGSGFCEVTGNTTDEDVDGGPTRLLSPTINLAGVSDPIVRYAAWFSNDDNDADRLTVEVSTNNGTSWTLMESIGNTGGWVQHTWHIDDFVTPTATMRFRFSASDNPNDSVTEAALDAFDVFEFECENNAVVAVPDTFTTVRGNVVSGGLAQLAASDNDRMRINAGFTILPSDPQVWLRVESVSPTEAPTALTFTIEANVNTPNTTQTVRLFNYDTSLYEQVSVTTALAVDTVLTIPASGDLARFVENGTGRMRAEMTWKAPPVVLLFPWTVAIDQAVWTVTP